MAIVLFAPLRDGAVAPVALELATIAQQLGDETIEAYAFGEGAEGAAEQLGAHGVGRLAIVDLAEDSWPVPTVAAALEERVAAGDVEALLFPATYDGRDLAAQLSAALDLPVLANAIGLHREGEGVVAEHAVFGGSEIVRAALTSARPGLYLVRAKSVEAAPSGGGAATVAHVSATPSVDTVRVVARHVETSDGPALEDARVVVSAGRGIGAPERVALVERLAELLGGAVGASRAVVDAGWTPYARQVGQTGKTVKPEVYVACGISGATQHLVGMKGARHVLAINRDASAPIFSISELGVVADLTTLLPALIAALEQRR